jgi:outer membrane protein
MTRALIILPLLGLAFNVNASELIVNVSNAPPRGTLIVQAFNSPNAFGDFRAPVAEQRARLEDGATVRVTGIPGGQIAVLAFVDKNDNGILDKNFIGIPRETLGISNGYRPKGPPVFNRASVTVPPGETVPIDIELFRVLGERGRLGIGAGAVGQSSPYRDSDETVLQAIPAITYNGERLQWVGPNVQYGVLGSGRLRLALSASYRIGAYEEDDSDVLTGLGDRDSTLLAGLGLRYELPGGVNLLARYEHDVLDNIGGGQGRVRLSKGFQTGIFRLIPQLSVNWLASDLANHDFGVPASVALPGRPAYAVGDVVSVEAGFGSFIEITENWRAIINLSVEQFGDEVGDSPIVDTDRVVRGFAAITYVF